MQTKFKKGDIVKTRTSGETVMVIEYKINYAGSVFNALSRSKVKEYEDAIVTDTVLCEGPIDGKFQQKYINEANLELVATAVEL